MTAVFAGTKPRSRFLEGLMLFSPVLLAVLIMLPRLLSPQFGMLDDGQSLVIVNKIMHGQWDMRIDTLEGRYRPMYWLWFALFYALAGENPFWFFFGNMLALIGAVAGVIFIVKRSGASSRAAWLAGIFLALASPAIESYYTLSKGETLQATMMVASVVAVLFYRSDKGWGYKAGIFALTIILLLFAYTSKETSIVILPIALVWFLSARYIPWLRVSVRGLSVRGAYVIANLICFIIYYSLHIYFVSWQMNTGTYSQRYGLELGKIVASMLRWAGWLWRDYAYLLPLILFLLMLVIARRKIDQKNLLFESLIWMSAWVALYLPWYFMQDYYIMPFALGAAIFAGLVVNLLLEYFSSPVFWERWLARFVLVISGLFFTAMLLTNITTARVQLSVDAANEELLAYLRATPQNSVILLNIQSTNEYYYKFIDYLNRFWGRDDLSIQVFDFQGTSAGSTYYLIAPYVLHQPLQTVRMGVVEEIQNKWNESLSPYFSEQPGWQQVAQIERQFTMTGVNLPRLFCPFIKTRAFCATPAPFVDTRPFVYGWTIYKLERP
jgi:hypothetical protein